MASPITLPSFQFCIPPNPTFGVLRSHAELNLRKLRNGLNIAGIRREVSAYAGPTDTVSGMPVLVNGQISLPGGRTVRPTAYRYAVLIERAKELAQQAGQLEALFLGAAEKRDEAAYSLMNARHELTLAQSQVRLQDLRLSEANHGVKLAELQEQRAMIQLTTYQEWISRGLNEYEQLMLSKYSEAATTKREAALQNASAQVAQAVVTAAGAGMGAAAAAAGVTVAYASAPAAAMSLGQLARTERDVQVAALQATHERRVDEWRLQSTLAAQDSEIGHQEVILAQDRTQIVQQEKVIAETQASQVRDTIEFLSNKFSGFELYDWMSGVLSDVYRTVLQQATSVARVAQAQLAFERQETPPAIIRSDYWSAPNSNPLGASSKPEDRQGVTGSARLLADIYQLDQYAFDTNKRKLAVSKTISLSQLAPAEFQRFRETGVIVFNTPMELFDRDFPGHYLRLIRRLRTSVIALIPTTEGIRATLSNTGISRVVIGPEIFQAIPIRRDPETVALSAPIGSTGVFELDESSGSEMYLPFEGHGVDGTWELRLPKPSNRFDYRTIADVLITFEYMALNNFDYGRQVIQQLDDTLLADRAFSLKHQFADAWYDLHNSELVEESKRMIVQFPIGRDDFPSNFESIAIRNITLYVSRADGIGQEVEVEHLKLIRSPVNQVVGGKARTIDGTISTRRGNGSTWQPLVGAGIGGDGRTPFGVWELSLRNENAAVMTQLKDSFTNDLIEDILLVISYAGRTPPWPA